MSKRGPRRVGAIKQQVGRRLGELREAQALSQAELARRAGTSTSQVNLIERGERAPTVVSLQHLARALRVPIASFFEAEETPPRSRAEAVWYRIMGKLRERDAEYLRAVETLLASFDRALQHASAPK